MYTIAKWSEEPPKIDDLIPLKVKVPKIKLSKYFELKHINSSPTKTDSLHFMSTNPNFSQDYASLTNSPKNIDHNSYLNITSKVSDSIVTDAKKLPDIYKFSRAANLSSKSWIL